MYAGFVATQMFYLRLCTSFSKIASLSRLMRKPTICICENKGADQLRSYCEADQRLCFRYTDSTIPLVSKSKISSFYQSPVLKQLGLCRTCSETTLLVFPRGGSFTLLVKGKLLPVVG